MRFTFGLPTDEAGGLKDPSDVIDAEFVFLQGTISTLAWLREVPTPAVLQAVTVGVCRQLGE